MSRYFLTILNMSLTAGILLLLVLLLRMVFKKIPKRYFCILWAVAALRLIIPFSLPQAAGAMQVSPEPIPVGETYVSETEDTPPQVLPEHSAVVAEVAEDTQTAVSQGNTFAEAEENVAEPVRKPIREVRPQPSSPAESVGEASTPAVGTNTKESSYVLISAEQTAWKIAAFVWLLGTATLVLYAGICYVRLLYRVRASVHEEGKVYLCKRIQTPFILGLFRPRIYLPEQLTAEEKELILTHEKMHIRSLDYLSKPFAFLILSVHWFNPLVWAAYFSFCRDIEIACDERVMASLGGEKKKAYASVLLQASLPERHTLVAPAAFGETAVKERIREILHYRKPSSAVTILCIVLIAAVTLTACVSESPVRLEESSPAAQESFTETKELTAYEQSLLELQNEMMEPVLREATTPRESDRVIFEIIDKATEICLEKSNPEKQVELYDEMFRPRDNASPYRRVLHHMLFSHIPGKWEEENAESKTETIRDFVRRIEYRVFDMKKTDPDGVFNEMLHSAIEQYLQQIINVDSEYYGSESPILLYGSDYPYLKGVLLGEIDPDTTRITLSQVLGIIEESFSESDNRIWYIYEQFLNLQHAADYDFVGSGTYGSTTFYLSGNNENVQFMKGGDGYSEIMYNKTNEDGTRYREYLFKETYYPEIDDKHYSPAHKYDPTRAKVCTTEPSPEAIGLLKYTSHCYESCVEAICARYPDCTQEQMDRILILYDLEFPHMFSYAYRVQVEARKIDPSDPKLTLADIKEIVARAGSIVKANPYHTTEAKNEIIESVKKIQKVPDWTNRNTYKYWPDSNSPHTRTEEIILKPTNGGVYYNTYDTEGNLVSSETLLEVIKY